MRAKPEVGIPSGALARRFLEAGATRVMIESEGITENVRAWRTDAVARIVDALGLGA
jgi:hypothetical protein